MKKRWLVVVQVKMVLIGVLCLGMVATGVCHDDKAHHHEPQTHAHEGVIIEFDGLFSAEVLIFPASGKVRVSFIKDLTGTPYGIDADILTLARTDGSPNMLLLKPEETSIENKHSQYVGQVDEWKGMESFHGRLIATIHNQPYSKPFHWHLHDHADCPESEHITHEHTDACRHEQAHDHNH